MPKDTSSAPTQTTDQESTHPVAPIIKCSHTKLEDPRTLRPNPRNPNQHPSEQIRVLLKIINATGWRAPIVISTRSGLVTKGHGRLEAALLGNHSVVPVDCQDYASEEEELSDLLADNLVADMADLQRRGMDELLAQLTAAGHDPELAGFLKSQQDSHEEKKKLAGNLSRKFIVPPFSVLDTRSGPWTERRQLWERLGINSALGRDDNLTYAQSAQTPVAYKAKNEYEQKIGRQCSWEEFIENNPQVKLTRSTSSFNPALCEVLFHWFCPAEATILDPFAGGCAAGIVAAVLGHRFIGVELREEQIAENYRQSEQFWSDTDIAPKFKPTWLHGDSTKLDDVLKSQRFDFIMSSPPYHDLEKYSNAPTDLSNQTEERFREMLATVVKSATERLYPNRFSAWVCGDYRPNNKTIRFMAGDIIDASPSPLYNNAVYITPASSLAIRVSKTFQGGRKLGKTHQNVVFLYNGDPVALNAVCDGKTENLLVCFNGSSKSINEALGEISGRDIIPLGDILQQLTDESTRT